MKRLASSAVLLVLLAAPAVLSAQGSQQPVIQERLNARGQAGAPPEVAGGLPPQSADQTRNRLQNLLFRMPPNVRAVLQADPSLIQRPDYLAPYPELVAFLEEHPEVARNPGFFLGSPSFGRGPDPLDVFAAILAGTGLFLGFLTVMFVFGSVARQVVDYRRWVRQTRMQAEVHTKILDRMQSNDDLLSYIQTPAGKHFLEFAPVSAESPSPAAAPFGRILWSVQAGVVLTTLGLGLRFARGSVPEEIVPAFTVLGIIVGALGLGAVVSAAVAYLLSARLGLLPPRRQET